MTVYRRPILGAGDAPTVRFGRLQQLCRTLTLVLPATGAGISLLTEDYCGAGTAAAADPVSRHLDQAQLNLGEGPGIEAFTTRRPVEEPDLATHGQRRWPGYAPAALDHGVRAVFAFPLQVGTARLGALTIYRDTPGPLSDDALHEGTTFADVAVSLLLDEQRTTTRSDPGGPGGPGALGGLDEVIRGRAEVYQAQGIVMVEHRVSLNDAMALLRGRAYTQNRDLIDVARDIVTGRLTLNPDPRPLRPPTPEQ